MLWSSIEALSLATMSFITLAMLARYLDATRFGKAAIALGVVQIACSFVESFFHDAVVQRKGLRPEDVDAAHTGGVLMAVALTCAVCACAAVLAHGTTATAEVDVTELTLWMLPSVLMASWSAMSVATLRRQLSMRRLAMASAGSRLVAALATVIALWQGLGVWALVINQNLAALSLIVLLRCVAAPSPRLSWDLSGMKRLVGYAALNSISGLLNANLSRFFQVLSALVLPASVVGQLSLALRVVEMLVSVLVTGVSRVTLSRLAAALRGGQPVAAGFVTTTRKVCFVMVPVLVLMAALADPLVRFIGRDGWEQASVFVAWFALAQALRSPTFLANTLFLSLGKPRLSLLVSVVDLGSLALLTLALQSPLAWIARLAVVLPLVLVLLQRQAGIELSRLLPAVFEPFVAGAAMGVLLAWGLPSIAGTSSPALTLVLGGLAGAALYAALLWPLLCRLRLAARMRALGHSRSVS